MTATTTERDDVPADDQFDDPDGAAERAAELGLGGVHWHPDGDGGRVWMPGGSHADYEAAVDQEAGLRDDWEDRLVQQDDPCWDGYTMVGLQDDGTPRCVPDDDVENYDEDKAATEQQAVGDDEWSAEMRLFRVVPAEDEADQYTDDVLGVGVSFPEAGVYVDWHREAFPDPLDDPHVSEYGSVADLQNATGNQIVDFTPPAGATSATEQEEREVPEEPETSADHEGTSQAAVEQQATYGEGEAVRWSWQGEPVHGRVAEVREEAATPEGSDQQITGDDGEPVYLIDEWDNRVEAFRRENVAKPESSLSPPRKDLPARSDDAYVDSEAWASLTMPVRESEFSTAELDHVAAAYPNVLQQLDATTWALADGAAVYTADVPARYDDIDLTPTEGMQAAAERVLDVSDETDNPNGCLTPAGWARARDIAGGGRLRPDTWREMDAFFARKGAQGSDDADGREDRTDCQYMEWQAWGGDAGESRAATVTDQLDRADADAEMELQGAVAAQRSVESITEADSNRVDLDSLTDEERAAVEADDFHVYGKASIEQWNRDESVYIQMDALKTALERFFESETAPGIISRHHQDIPVGVPVREFEFAEDTTLQIGDEAYDFAAGDMARSHVEDADGDGRPELWLAANISNDNEMAKKTRVLALRDDLDGFSVTIHRNEDRVTEEGGTIVTAADLHAVTIGTAEQIRNEGSEFDVASYSAAAIRRVRDRVASFVG
jgi:hypothetical protein